MSQFARPSADSLMSDLWTPFSGGVCYAMINETSQDADTSYIVATITSGTAVETVPSVRLSTVTDPQVDTGFVTQYYTRKELTTSNFSINMGLYQGNPNSVGSTLLDSWSALVGGTSYSLRMRNHADAVCAAITDYSNLYLAIGASTGGTSTIRFTYAALILPDAPASTSHRRQTTGSGS